ncbi:MAG: UDP-N-acetylglucosamine 2-epimerase (non-hydrolyzing) [Chloroflexi bacterium]|nr:UDP-N-acetylglucosamine 2-epimerase (non-hydrolyzing) [Chloroflexota bacterium]
MPPIKVLSIAGTRPEAIKMAPVVRALQGQPQQFESHLCVTAQHRQMLDQVLELFQIQPDFDLNLMKPNQTLAEITASIFTHLDPLIEKLKPDWILSQGDTTTVMATALLAYYHQVRFGHVEAGLRTGDKFQPFPEEINRRVAGVVADLHFAPTSWSRDNLLKENVPANQIIVTGNPVIDALQWVAERPFDLSSLKNLGIDLEAIKADGKEIILVTAHRRENFGEPLENICRTILSLTERYQGKVHFIYPVHLNPNVQKVAYPMLGNNPHITLVPPLDYLPMVNILKRSRLALTDSGGLQEEAPGFGVPVLVMREVTERPEGVQAGIVQLVGTDPQKIFTQTCRLLDDPAAYASMAQAVNPYGDGHAAERITEAIIAHS